MIETTVHDRLKAINAETKRIEALKHPAAPEVAQTPAATATTTEAPKSTQKQESAAADYEDILARLSADGGLATVRELIKRDNAQTTARQMNNPAPISSVAADQYAEQKLADTHAAKRNNNFTRGNPKVK